MSFRVRLLAVFLLLAAIVAGCAPAALAPPGSGAEPTSPAAQAAPTAPLSPASAPTTTPVQPAPTVAPVPAVGATPSADATVAGFPVTVTDDAGNTVTFDRPPRRIVSLSPGHTETLYALGLAERIVATDTYSDYPPRNKAKATITTFPKPSVEVLVALRPDLIVDLVQGPDFTRQMQAHGIPVLTLFPKNFAGTLRDIDLLGRVTGTAARAGRITATMRTRADAIVAKTKDAPRPTVLYELDASDPTKPFVAGSGGFYGELIPMAGGKNIFADIRGPSAQVSAEQIIARDPDIIILADAHSPYNAQTPAMVRARPGWGQITAVKEGRIYEVDDALLTRPGPRLVDGLAELAKIFHPELFR